MSDKWGKLKEALDEPVKLSEPEKEQLKAVFKQMHALLNEGLEKALEGNRDDAYRYSRDMVNAFDQGERRYEAGPQPEPVKRKPIKTEREHVEEESVEKTERGYTDLSYPVGAPREKTKVELGPKPDFNEILEELTETERTKAKKYLDCVKNGLKLLEAGEDPNQILCYALDRVCSIEEMRKCIITEDPSVRDIMDQGGLPG
ncbi:hypothetical protein KKH23_08885 [Patescibacteria group bacterium]|uniref:Uncharacterized protein n=1 Tax=viral metagenome TaxID=1070528 RepID=A0A6M3M0A5_9ZZZZ|nr:hypothetical protein [Patescibacteria group bacterium]